ncbi:transketolase [Candidatus Kaiserbacteria bacterium RIFCSPHIGHO2_02_FULL_55_20]|uniref:Transketolase n=1 Tax=Candidatus Kaiserbacteria bacterium RIFCSPHIGHO2_02_FULL_55_20 TaxID=1798497 RepID=A0A1F6DWM6_9BACT|nr:MAG: transketolase [Candidatus Kaiserbacteria bacterium RIFCSPHIGHO2_01_FULL_55_37]OGG65796.1 MAG: transketolase [Candidatus Kaiserbacteria bacterium RIFCSPHIGHO2_02_FULL_55_20]
MPKLKRLAALIRHHILTSSTAAGSGHPTSSLSATDLMTALFFGGFFRFDVKHPQHYNNDRLIFSKGHASPLFYALWAVAGGIPKKELNTLRKFGSRLEGHPTMEFPFTEVPTGSLGQGLAVGVGMSLVARREGLPFKTYVLLGDSEMAEGSVWEAMQSAAYYKLNNLTGIIDVNRLGQSRETMHGHDVAAYARKCKAFGWEVIVVDGHALPEITSAFQKASRGKGRPVMIIAKTFKGAGISFLENKPDWHGKALKKGELEKALAELGPVKTYETAPLKKPSLRKWKQQPVRAAAPVAYKKEDKVATRKAYGNALTRIRTKYPHMAVLDAEVSNSTYADGFKNAYPMDFFEMFIAEQNMAGVALGMWRRGKIPFISTFSAFLSRAYDQIRMAQYAGAHIVCAGSHAGVSIGEDGASQMGLEDIAMFRSVLGSSVLYPSDAVSCDKLTEASAGHKGVIYIRTTRQATPILYENDETFPIGGSKVLRRSGKDVATVVAAGITLHEALAAHAILKKEGINVRVVDLYTVKPLDVMTLKKAAKETGTVITVEDHHIEGGLGEAVARALSQSGGKVLCLAVEKMPHSGKPEELLAYEGISAAAIVKAVRSVA